MAYIRKTRDIYVVEGDYGWGFEEVTWCDTFKEAKQDIKDYRDNEPYPFRIRKKRVRVNDMGCMVSA